MDQIMIGNIKIVNLQNSSNFSIGPAVLTAVSTHNKDTSALGDLIGDGGVIHSLVGFVDDPDVLDTPIWITAWPGAPPGGV